MKKLSVTEVSELAGKSARHIRNLCKEGKLPCDKVKISTGEKYLILTGTEEFKSLIGEGIHSSVEEDVIPYEGTFISSQEEQFPPSDNSWTEVITSMTSKIEALAKEAGKSELLTDTLMTSEQNVKFYQDEYFKIRHDLEAARDTISKLEKENASLQKKSEELDILKENISQTFWGKRFLAKNSPKN